MSEPAPLRPERAQDLDAPPVDPGVAAIEASLRARSSAGETAPGLPPGAIDRRRRGLYAVWPEHLERRRARPAEPAPAEGPPVAVAPAPGRLRRAVRGPLAFLHALAVGLVVTGLVVLGAALATGHRPFTVVSSSMEPVLGVGDVVVAEPVSPLDLRVGDVVTFPDPQQRGRTITHRVRSLRVRSGKVSVVTRGDANNTPERWTVRADGEVGRVRLRAPELGHASAWLREPWRRMAFLVFPAFLLGGLELWRIWRPRRREERS